MSIGQDIADWATGVGVIVAIGFGILGDRRALKAAERAEAAARTADSYTERVVQALEQIAAAQTSASPPPRVSWKIEAVEGDRYVLRNVGNAVALDVHVFSHKSLPLLDVPDGVDIPPHGNWSFMASPSLATSDRSIGVDWRDEDFDAHEWRYPLPPRRRFAKPNFVVPRPHGDQAQ